MSMSYIFTIPYSTNGYEENTLQLDTRYKTSITTLYIPGNVKGILYRDGTNVNVLTGLDSPTSNVMYRYLPSITSSTTSANITDNNYPNYYFGIGGFTVDENTALYEIAPDLNTAKNALYTGEIQESYPIRYTANNCTLSAPSTASPGQDVVININPATGYSFRGASGVSIVDSYGDNVPFIINGNQIAFTMPQP